MATKIDCFNCEAETEADIKLERHNTAELHLVGICKICGWKSRVDT